MSDNIEKNIKQLAELLSQDNAVDNLQKLLTTLISSKPRQDEKPREQSKNIQDDNFSRGDLRTLENIVRAVSELREANDPGVNLLMSLKPFLRRTRKNALDDCVKILHMARIYEYMREHEETSNL